MKILYIHQYFKTPREPGATRIYFIVQQLIKDGHEVTVITQRKNAKISREVIEIDNIKVVYLKNSYSNSMSIPQRIKSFFNFMWKATFESFKHKDIDLVVSTSTPLSVGIPALLLKKIRKTPYIFEVRDLWPEVPIQMGGLKNRFAKRIAIGVEKSIYKNATHIVALSPGMYEGVLKYTPDEKISMIPNMAKTDHFWPREKDTKIYDRLNLSHSTFKLIHFGTMGIANGLMYILEAAKILKEKQVTDIDIIMLGEGKASDSLKEFAEANDLTNVHFYDRVPMKETSEIVNACDVSLVSFLNIPILSTNSPNKLFDSLAAAKPIVVNSNGWTRKMVEENHCGAYVDPEKPAELSDLLVDWKEQPEKLKEMSLKSRHLAENDYNAERLTKQFVSIVNTVLEKK